VGIGHEGAPEGLGTRRLPSRLTERLPPSENRPKPDAEREQVQPREGEAEHWAEAYLLLTVLSRTSADCALSTELSDRTS
jgi:hypothetical protein